MKIIDLIVTIAFWLVLCVIAGNALNKYLVAFPDGEATYLGAFFFAILLALKISPSHKDEEKR